MDLVLRQKSRTYSDQCGGVGLVARLMGIAGGKFSVTGIVIVPLCLFVMLDEAAAEDRFDLRRIASKEWEEISNEEIIYAYEQYFGDSGIAKFKPGFCTGRAYYVDDDATIQRIDRRIREFEDLSNLREYGYSIYEPSEKSEGCSNGNHILGIFGDVYGKYSFLFRMETEVPVFLENETWAEFKRFRFCAFANLRSEELPPATRALRLGIGLINVREEMYLGSLEACVDGVLWGTLVGMGGTQGCFSLLSMGFSEETARSLATTFVRVLYHPDMEFGNFKFHERKAKMTDILSTFRISP